jgi:mersacidin/lichenicidin family type 2 lantibiotic
MAHVDVIRAWKDEDYRQSLSDAQRAMLPPHPAGLIELAEEQMGGVVGGSSQGGGCYHTASKECYTQFSTCTC